MPLGNPQRRTSHWMPALRLRQTLPAILAVALLCSAPTRGAEAAEVFRLGVISEQPQAPGLMLRRYRSMRQYLQDWLKDSHIDVAEVAVATDLDEMQHWIEQGRVDALMESLSTTLTLEHKTGAIEPALLAWRKGQRAYRTHFFARTDSPIRRLEDLTGRSIAFESPRSTSAFFIPKLSIEHLGMRLRPAETAVAADAVAYRFAGSELNQAYWVQRGITDAGAFNDGDWERTPQSVRKDLRVFHTTPPVLRYLCSFHSRLNPSTREHVQAALVKMHEDPRGKAALQDAYEISRIEVLTAADQAQLKAWRAMISRLDD